MNNIIHYTCITLIATIITLPCVGMDKERVRHEAILAIEHKKIKNLRTSNKENAVNLGRSLRGSGKKERDERAHINDVYEEFRNLKQ